VTLLIRLGGAGIAAACTFVWAVAPDPDPHAILFPMTLAVYLHVITL
jgi:hypothetical protein